MGDNNDDRPNLPVPVDRMRRERRWHDEYDEIDEYEEHPDWESDTKTTQNHDVSINGPHDADVDDSIRIEDTSMEDGWVEANEKDVEQLTENR